MIVLKYFNPLLLQRAHWYRVYCVIKYVTVYNVIGIYSIVTNPESKTNLTVSAVKLLPSSEQGYHDDVVVALPPRQLAGPLSPRAQAWSLGRLAVKYLLVLLEEGVPHIRENVPLPLWSVEGLRVGMDLDGLFNPPQFPILFLL